MFPYHMLFHQRSPNNEENHRIDGEHPHIADQIYTQIDFHRNQLIMSRYKSRIKYEG